jgi:hypothetical protein
MYIEQDTVIPQDTIILLLYIWDRTQEKLQDTVTLWDYNMHSYMCKHRDRFFRSHYQLHLCTYMPPSPCVLKLLQDSSMTILIITG